jgi:predicted phosphodiesterase
VAVFAIEDSTLQLEWARLPTTDMTIEVGDRSFAVGAAPPEWYRLKLDRKPVRGSAGPGALLIEGLDPDTTYDVWLSGREFPRRLVATARTLSVPPGRLLARFATISDCHIGEFRLGPLGRLHDPRPRPEDLAPYPIRCARAAIVEAEAWGAELLVVKGDLTREAAVKETADVADVLETASIPVHVTLGNHDVRGPADVAAVLAARGIAVGNEARAVDIGGVRLVLGHSPVPGLHSGRLDSDHVKDLVALAAAAPGPVILVLHHPLRRWPVSTYYPPAISWKDSSLLVSGLAGSGQTVLVLAGHTHRNRRYPVGGLPVAEVGSTKDYPGQWAGYAIYEGGVRQVVRRIARPDVISWTEMTKRAIGGIWGMWSPGSLSDRCWTLDWPSGVASPTEDPPKSGN